MWGSLVLLLLVSHAYSDSCITYSFEEGYNDLFITDLGVCASALPLWDIESYENTGLSPPHQFSTLYIYPHKYFSCVSSFMFNITAGGVVEVNVYMESSESSDSIQVLVMQYEPGWSDAVVGQAFRSPSQGNYFVNGWHTMRMTIAGTRTITGYISIMGMAVDASTVLVDSFRYIPPGVDESDCIVYTLEPPTSESPVTTEITTQPTTTESITEPITTEIITEPAATEIINETTTTDIITDSTTTNVAVETTTKVTTSSVTNTDSTETTELPTTLPESDDVDDAFWTPLRLGLLGVLLLLIFMMLCSFCYCCCRSKPTVVIVKA